jgi:hypothetical protein
MIGPMAAVHARGEDRKAQERTAWQAAHDAQAALRERLELLATRPRAAALRDMGDMALAVSWSWPCR